MNLQAEYDLDVTARNLAGRIESEVKPFNGSVWPGKSP